MLIFRLDKIEVVYIYITSLYVSRTVVFKIHSKIWNFCQPQL